MAGRGRNLDAPKLGKEAVDLTEAAGKALDRRAVEPSGRHQSLQADRGAAARPKSKEGREAAFLAKRSK